MYEHRYLVEIGVLGVVRRGSTRNTSTAAAKTPAFGENLARTAGLRAARRDE
jgi:hypothetical protein